MMGLMKLVEAAVKTTVQLPVAIVKDFVTLGGALNDEDSAIVETCKEIAEDIDEIAD